MAKTAQAFIDEYNGKVDDFDNVYGAQCVDAYKRFCKWLGVPVKATRTGWADGYWTYRLDMANYVTYITDPAQLRKGDWCFWAKNSSCPSSHVAMYVSASSKGYGNFFGQNQGGNGGYRTVKLKLDILGAFRFKALESETAEWRKDSVGWWYRHADGSYPANAWEKIGGKWYWFNAKGYMATGWVKTGGKWYFLQDSGAMLANSWKEWKGKWYYLGSDGAMFTGNHQVNVHFNSEGAFDGNKR